MDRSLETIDGFPDIFPTVSGSPVIDIGRQRRHISSKLKNISATTVTIYTDRDRYHSGEHVQGKVEVNVQGDDRVCSEITIELKGQAETKIHRFNETLEENADLMQSEVVLETFFDGSIPCGRHTYPFSIELPPNLPGSCHADIPAGSATIIYALRVYVHRGRIKHLIERLAIKILEESPKKTYQTSKEDIVKISPQNLSLCCFRRGDIILKAQVPDAILFASRPIPVMYEVYNNSATKITHVTFKLLEEWSFSAHLDEASESTVLAETKGKEVLPKSGFGELFGTTCREAFLQISPSIRFSGTSTQCRLIQICHTIFVEAHTGSSHVPKVSLSVFLTNDFENSTTGRASSLKGSKKEIESKELPNTDAPSAMV